MKDNAEDMDGLKQRLHTLRREHRELDTAISDLMAAIPFDQIKVQRLKKRKLRLKEQIAAIEDILNPDIIA